MSLGELLQRLYRKTETRAGGKRFKNGNTQVICDNGWAKPCPSATTVQFITHTLAGTRNGTTGGVTFEFDWTPPGTDAGDIKLYAAGNAANGNNQNTGDHIYTTSVELVPASASPKPTISANGGVVNGASFQAGIAQNSWVTIFGSKLAQAPGPGLRMS